MNTSYALDGYRAHDLNIAMKTSSGDVITMDFANRQSLSLSSEQNEKGSKSSLSFSSMQSFAFSIEGNGIDAQDEKEIKEFMKIAQPFIDDFLKELQQDAPQTPVTKLAQKVASIFEPSKQRDENAKNHVKSNMVEMFDNSLAKIDNSKMMDKIFADAQKLLEKTLQAFDNFNKEIYA
jgi:hypothetical protein